jgi:hypothetical protein
MVERSDRVGLVEEVSKNVRPLAEFRWGRDAFVEVTSNAPLPDP